MTFLVKLTARLLNKIKNDKTIYEKIVSLCNEIIKLCDETSNISMKNKIQTKLCEIYLINENYKTALDLVSKTLVDLKRYEDNLGLIELQLIESKIHHSSKGLVKAKVFINIYNLIVGSVNNCKNTLHESLY